jgi:hypothetical protein
MNGTTLLGMLTINLREEEKQYQIALKNGKDFTDLKAIQNKIREIQNQIKIEQGHLKLPDE